MQCFRGLARKHMKIAALLVNELDQKRKMIVRSDCDGRSRRIGAAFAMTEAILILAMVAQRYRLRLKTAHSHRTPRSHHLAAAVRTANDRRTTAIMFADRDVSFRVTK